MQESMFEIPRKIPIFSLQKLCLIKVSSIVCNNQQLLVLILKCKHFYDRFLLQKTKAWKAAQTKADEIILQICKSVILRRAIKELFWPMSYRIILWKGTFAPCIANKFLNHIVWTDVGKINNIATAKHIIENKNIGISRRFILACKLCLIEDVHKIWLEMSDKKKIYYLTKYRGDYRPLLVFCLDVMEESDDVVELYMQNALECAIKCNLLDAIKYIFSILRKYESYYVSRNETALSCLSDLDAKIEDDFFQEEVQNDICYFLLSQVQWTEECRFSTFGFRMLSLSLLIHSSEYDKAIEALQNETGLFYLDGVLQMIFKLYHLGITYQDNDYQNLFVGIWRALSVKTKKLLTTNTDLGSICVCDLIFHDFPFLLKAEAFKMMNESPMSNLKCSTSKSTTGFYNEKWEFLLFLIREEVATMAAVKKRLVSLIKCPKVQRKRILRFFKKIRQQYHRQEL